MAAQNLWQRLVTVVNHEYERRVRAASLVTEYGAHHGHEAHDDHEDEGEVAVIANVPRGTRVARHAGAPDSAQH